MNKANKEITSTATNSDEPIWERLNIEKEKKDKIAQDKERRKTQHELNNCTFKPQIKYHPAHEVYDGNEKIWERLHEEQMGFSVEEPTGADQETFRPQINELSEQLVSNGRDDAEPIHERLFSIDLKKKQEEREKEKAKRELQNCTFKPERASTKNPEVNVNTEDIDVFDRLVTNETQSASARKAARSPDSVSNSPSSPSTATPKKKTKPRSTGGLSFLERMALASAKQKSSHKARSPPSGKIVRRVPRPPAATVTADETSDDAPSLPQTADDADSYEEEEDDEDVDDEEDVDDNEVADADDATPLEF